MQYHSHLMDVLKFCSRKSCTNFGMLLCKRWKSENSVWQTNWGVFFPLSVFKFGKICCWYLSITVWVQKSQVWFFVLPCLSLSTVAMDTIPTHCLFAESVKGGSRQTSPVISKITRWHLRSIHSSWWNNWTFGRHQDSFSCRESQSPVSGTQRLRPRFLH